LLSEKFPNPPPVTSVSKSKLAEFATAMP
jgi:hypothetical protein